MCHDLQGTGRRRPVGRGPGVDVGAAFDVVRVGGGDRFRGSTPGSWWTRPATLGPRGRGHWRRIFLTLTSRDRFVPARRGVGPWPVPAKARTWRERHHPVSIEKRHAKCVADRRVVFSPDRDGMAWFSAYLPADTASGIWQRTTAAARAMQGPDEHRTLTQMRADIAATLLLGGVPDREDSSREASASEVASTGGAGTMPAVESDGPGGPSAGCRRRGRRC